MQSWTMIIIVLINHRILLVEANEDNYNYNYYNKEKAEEEFHPEYNVYDYSNKDETLEEFNKLAETWKEERLSDTGNVVIGQQALNLPSRGLNSRESYKTTENIEELISTTEEPYEDAIERLKCDDPWFWNAFKCFYLDVRKRNYVERTKYNGITVAWIIGPPLCLLVLAICGFCAVTFYFKSRVTAFERKIDDLMQKYEPGSIELDDGTVRKYQPTQDEIDAFENMISTLVSIV